MVERGDHQERSREDYMVLRLPADEDWGCRNGPEMMRMYGLGGDGWRQRFSGCIVSLCVYHTSSLMVIA